MPRMLGTGARLIACSSVGLAIAALAATSPAQAAAPTNDNYLASTQMMEAGAVMRSFSQVVDTTAATTQPDLFNPDREGMPFAGGAAETTSCRGVPFGATVWYDFAPEVPGGVEILAGGYDTTVAVYEYDPRTATITRMVTCASSPGVGEEVLLPKVKRNTSYTIQVGGAAGASGMLDFKFGFFGDRDEDGIFDETPDKCVSIPGVAAAGGCPPELRTTIRNPYRDAAGGVRLTSLTLGRLPVGARVEARCGGCGPKQVRIARGATVSMTKFAGRFLRAGTRLEVFVSRSRTTSGLYKFGAIGNYFRYTVRSRGLSARTDRCLKPGSTTPLKRCT